MTRDELVDAYQDAIDDIESWAAYAPDYFKIKWKLDECLAGHRAKLDAALPYMPGYDPVADTTLQ
jgi:hypothetical protein